MAKKKRGVSKKSSSVKEGSRKSSTRKESYSRSINKTEIKGKWEHEGKKYIISYTKRKPTKNEIILTPEQLIKKIVEHDRKILVSIKNGEIKKDKLHLLYSTRENLKRGEIIGSKEAIIRKFQKIEEKFENIKEIKYKVLDNIYTATVESGQALLLKKGLSVDSPRDIPKKLEEVNAPNIKDAKYVIKTFKDLEHGDTKLPSGGKINSLFEKSTAFSKEAKNT